MLTVISRQEALTLIKEKFSHLVPRCECVPLEETPGRILFEDVLSKESIPCFDRSTVDGYAVMAEDTFGSSQSIPAQLTLKGEIFMGEQSDEEIGFGECIKISTGGMLPKNADAVVMVEHTDTDFDGLCLCFKAVSKYENVTRMGDDVKAGDTVAEKGTVISPRHIGVLSSVGCAAVPCVKRPVVGIVSTGDEVVPIEEKLTPGKVRDINSHILSALVKQWGCYVKLYGIIPDQREMLEKTVSSAAEDCDVVLISGGSSAGAKDMTVKIIDSLGETYFHGLAMKPGKPTILGNINGKAVFGLPGHPVAAYFVATALVKPVCENLLGVTVEQKKIKTLLLSNISSNHGREEIVCVKLTESGAVPVYGKSGVVSQLCRSDGYVIIDRNLEGLKKGAQVEVILF